ATGRAACVRQDGIADEWRAYAVRVEALRPSAARVAAAGVSSLSTAGTIWFVDSGAETTSVAEVVAGAISTPEDGRVLECMGLRRRRAGVTGVRFWVSTSQLIESQNRKRR